MEASAQIRVVSIEQGGEGQGHDLTDEIEGLSWSSVNPGGDERCTFTLKRSWFSESPEIARGNLLRVMCGIDVLWQGRVEETNRSAESTEAIAVTAYGLGARLKDGTFQEIFIDRDLGAWVEASRDYQAARLAEGHKWFAPSTLPDDKSGLPSIKLSLQEPWPTGARSVAMYPSPDIEIGELRHSRKKMGGDDLLWQTQLSKDATLAIDASASGSTNTPSTNVSLLGSGVFYAAIKLLTNEAATSGNETAESYYDIRVFGAHELAKQGEQPDEGFTVDQMVEFIVGLVPGIHLRRLDAQTYVVKQAAFKDPTLHEDGIAELNKLEGCDWGTWGPDSPLDISTDGQFDFKDREPETQHWFIRREDCDGDLSLHSETSTLYGAVDVTYEDVGGTRRTVRREVDVPDLDGAGLTRVFPLDIGKSTQDVAEQMGDAFLAIWGQFAPARGSFSVSAPVRHHERGELPPVYLRADGSNARLGGILPSTSALTLDDTPDRRTTFPIKRVEVDCAGEVPKARVDIDQANDTLSILQARQGLESELVAG